METSSTSESIATENSNSSRQHDVVTCIFIWVLFPVHPIFSFGLVYSGYWKNSLFPVHVNVTGKIACSCYRDMMFQGCIHEKIANVLRLQEKHKYHMKDLSLGDVTGTCIHMLILLEYNIDQKDHVTETEWI